MSAVGTTSASARKSVRTAGRWFLSMVAVAALACGLAILGARRSPVIAAALSGQDAVLTRAESAPSVINASETPLVRVPLFIRNVSWSSLTLVPRPIPCSPTSWEEVPASLGAFQAATCYLVVNAASLNGPQVFSAVIATSSPRTPQLTVSVPLHVQADEVRRFFSLGIWRADGMKITKRLTIDNVPSDKLVRVGQPNERGWKAIVVRSARRTIELELSGTTPSLPALTQRQDLRLSCDLYFVEADVRRVRVLGVALLKSEWEWPTKVAVNLLVTANGHVTFAISHYSLDPAADRSQVAIVSGPVEGLRSSVLPQPVTINAETPERKFQVTLASDRWSNGEIPIRVRLHGDKSDTFAEIPVVVTGF